MKDKLFAELVSLFALLSAFADGAGLDSKLEGRSRAQQAGVVISVVVIGVVALVGVLIFAQVNQAMPSLNDSPLDSTQDSITTGFGDSMEFVPIIMLVLLASVVIAVVQRMR